MKGWIALDIDGTLTLDQHSVPQKVIDYLKNLHDNGWEIALATGRSFTFASLALTKFTFPYTFLPQNGSLAVSMPEKKVLIEKSIAPDLLPLVERAFDGIDSDFLVYAGFEKGDICYYRKGRFSSEEIQIIEALQKREQKTWQVVEDFKNIGFIPLIKCFGAKEKMGKVAERLRENGRFEVAQIFDPFKTDRSFLLVTALGASKGKTLAQVMGEMGRGDFVIAAGDDENDVSLLEQADVKIAMSHAPKSLKAIANIIAPPTENLGIINALEEAVLQCK